MNLLNLDEAQRVPFSRLVAGLVREKGIDAKEIFLNALESEEAPEMNYWVMKVLMQEHFVSPQMEVAKDAAGEPVKALQAAALLNNVGAVAALLESGGFSGGVMDRDFQLTARIAAKQEDQAVMGVLMKYAQEIGYLETFMRSLNGDSVQ